MEVEKKKRKSNSAERIFLSDASQVQLRDWETQIQSETGGTVSVPLRELANFILQTRCGPLSPGEMDTLRDRYFDPVKSLTSVVEEVKTLRARGEKVDLEELLKKLRTQRVGEDRLAKRARRTRKNKVVGASGTAATDELKTPIALSQRDLQTNSD